MPGFTALQGVSGCLKGWRRILKTICFKQKTNMHNTAVLAQFGGGRTSAAGSKQANWVSPPQRLALLPEKGYTEQRLPSWFGPCLGDCARVQTCGLSWGKPLHCVPSLFYRRHVLLWMNSVVQKTIPQRSEPATLRKRVCTKAQVHRLLSSCGVRSGFRAGNARTGLGRFPAA